MYRAVQCFSDARPLSEYSLYSNSTPFNILECVTVVIPINWGKLLNKYTRGQVRGMNLYISEFHATTQWKSYCTIPTSLLLQRRQWDKLLLPWPATPPQCGGARPCHLSDPDVPLVAGRGWELLSLELLYALLPIYTHTHTHIHGT